MLVDQTRKRVTGISTTSTTRHQDQCHVLLVPVLAHLRSSSLPALQRVDQLHVEERDQQQRTSVNDNKVQHVSTWTKPP